MYHNFVCVLLQLSYVVVRCMDSETCASQLVITHIYILWCASCSVTAQGYTEVCLYITFIKMQLNYLLNCGQLGNSIHGFRDFTPFLKEIIGFYKVTCWIYYVLSAPYHTSKNLTVCHVAILFFFHFVYDCWMSCHFSRNCFYITYAFVDCFLYYCQ